jgi:hypothetical protein
MDAYLDASGLYDVERRARHAERPGFRISELQISPVPSVPWHVHTEIQDTFYALLALLGGVAARAGGAPATRGAVRVVVWGGLAMAVTYGVGALVGTAV